MNLAILIDMGVLVKVERYMRHKGTCDSKGGADFALTDLRAMMEKLK